MAFRPARARQRSRRTQHRTPHRSRGPFDSTTPNLRQVHLIHAELHDEFRQRGFEVAPDGSRTIVRDEAEDDYVVLCFVPDTDGAPHFAKGMMTALPTEGEASAAHIPDATVTLTAVDYGYKAPASLKAGKDIVIELMNNGTELHEANIVQLEPDATVEDFLVGLSPETTESPPDKPIGGIQSILPGEFQRATLNLEAGNYVLICYIRNAQDAPHLALGMAQPLEVTA